VYELLTRPPLKLNTQHVKHYVQKVTEQKEIVRDQVDNRVLRKALSAFTTLQHVQILRVQDQEDGWLMTYIRDHRDVNQLVELSWAPACSRSTETVVQALLAANSKCTRFSSPMITPSSARALVPKPLSHSGALAERLTCLELHFDDGGMDLDAKMRELSNVFRHVFNAAKNMTAVHVGFPTHRPLQLGLEELFHHVKWERLVAFGIQSWKLDADEIIALAERHRFSLKGLRLRDVLLREGSMWKDVLAYLADNMVKLHWASLRRIGYAKSFDEQFAMGVEILDDPPEEGSQSSDEDDWDPHGEMSETNMEPGDGNDSDSESVSSIVHSDAGTDNGAAGDAGMGFPPLSPDTPSSTHWHYGEQESYPNSAEELGDDGILVPNQKRKMWENWVVNKCMQHRAPSWFKKGS
jgi:hypothetical protein